MTWSNLLKSDNIEFTNNIIKKDIKNNEEKEEEIKPEDFFKNFDEEFEDHYFDTIHKIFFDLKDYFKNDKKIQNINYFDLYNLIKNHSKNSKKLMSSIEKHNLTIVEDFKNEELENKEYESDS